MVDATAQISAFAKLKLTNCARHEPRAGFFDRSAMERLGPTRDWSASAAWLWRGAWRRLPVSGLYYQEGRRSEPCNSARSRRIVAPFYSELRDEFEGALLRRHRRDQRSHILRYKSCSHTNSAPQSSRKSSGARVRWSGACVAAVNQPARRKFICGVVGATAIGWLVRSPRTAYEPSLGVFRKGLKVRRVMVPST